MPFKNFLGKREIGKESSILYARYLKSFSRVRKFKLESAQKSKIITLTLILNLKIFLGLQLFIFNT